MGFKNSGQTLKHFLNTAKDLTHGVSQNREREAFRRFFGKPTGPALRRKGEDMDCNSGDILICIIPYVFYSLGSNIGAGQNWPHKDPNYSCHYLEFVGSADSTPPFPDRSRLQSGLHRWEKEDV